MPSPAEPKMQTTSEELQAKRAELADKLGYLLARAWLRRREAKTDGTDQESKASASSPSSCVAPRGH